MCGIAGFYGKFGFYLLKEMGERIAHRGPDDQGEILLDNIVGLVHRRLAIIDLSKEGRQPMTVNCDCCGKGLWLTYNGELYNYRELREELIKKGHQFHSNTDSEVLLHLYTEEGIQMLKKLNGIFAYAIYDEKNKQLFLARDGLGVKPLYYCEIPSGFLFASELKALLACNDVSNSMDYTAIHYYLAYLWCPSRDTALCAIKKLEPGEAIIVEDNKIIKRWFYYDIPYHGNYLEHSEDVLCEELLHHLKNAVKRQLVSDVPVGAFLSGGLDSSAIVAIMKNLQQEVPINTYCVGFDEGMKSEGNPNDIPYAKSVASHLNVKLHVLEVTADMIKKLPQMIYHLDEPQADPAPLNVYLIAELAKQHNIKVLLSGAGGDDLFSGYRRHQSLELEKLWRLLPNALRHHIAAFAGNLQDGHYSFSLMNSTPFRRVAKMLSSIHLSQDERIAHHFLWNSDRLRQSLYSKDMLDMSYQMTTAEPLLKSLQHIPSEKNLLNRMLYLEGKHFLPHHNLNYTDKMSMALGIEVRVPLLDLDLVRFATQIPPRFKQKKNISKAIFKKTMEPFLPRPVIYRPKAGFGAPMRRWLHHELKEFVNDTLSKDSIKKHNIFDADAVQQLLTLDKQGRVDASYTIFSIVCIDLWIKQFVEQRAAIKPSVLW